MRRRFSFEAMVLAAFWCLPGKPLWAFFSVKTTTVTASVSLSGSLLTLSALPLPGAAFFGKNVVIPVQVTGTPGPLNLQTLNVSMVYRLYDANGAPLTNPVSVPVSFAPGASAVVNSVTGTALIPIADLNAIQNGGRIDYIFSAQEGGAGALFNHNGQAPTSYNVSSGAPLPSPFSTEIIDQLCVPVSPSGSIVNAPDLFVQDGETSVSLAPGAIASPGTLCIKRENTSGWPTGPGGTAPVVVYSITLNDTSLLQTAGLTISYPVNVNGQIEGLNTDPDKLGLYWLGPENAPTPDRSWQILSRAQVDSTRHTVAGFSGHFSTFAVFSGNALNSAASIRPATRIITPNGDGINDTITFSGLTSQDEVKIFDIRGRRIRRILGPSPVWDGTDDSGAIVESGVYIYQYTSQGDRVSGVIMVAK